MVLTTDMFTNEEEFKIWFSAAVNERAERSPENYEIPYKRLTTEVIKKEYQGLYYYDVKSQGAISQEASNQGRTQEKTILFFHGGGFVIAPSTASWHFINEIVDESGISAKAVLYPRLPFSNSEEAFAQVKCFYDKLAGDAENGHEFILMGDSAGCQIIMNLYFYVKEAYGKCLKTILFSPWLDLGMSDPESVMLQEKDRMLNMYFLKKCGEMWADGKEVSDKTISPINREYLGCENISLFTGTADIIYPDSRRLHEKLELAGVQHNYYVRENLMHDYTVLTMKGLKLDKEIIMRILL